MALIQFTFGVLGDSTMYWQALGLPSETITLEAVTLRDALRQVAFMSQTYTPERWLQVFFDDQGQMRRFYVVSFQDGRSARQNLDVPLRDGDQIYLRR